ncbi:AAA family ATPase [Leptolyngbya cf. ectocarpi LEGE 11479]|uniref:AAA family ATPase n=1 Tax=Leptolyngbya cf. ectocarpi LEGE 11479 TaxID=1828722 RepID=A0A928ZUA2_LEPEC|nr:AAA family ATPase [Leptolyngbya ectocarpi]MBE9067564.1 AAA family ATPase [Leptolyngbya cf. ectocarpi LEGE 11479]
MLTSIQIENFRCFDTLKVDGLSRVNLIAGKNNVGKTAFLEAIGMWASGSNPAGLTYLSGMRSLVEKVTSDIAQELLLAPLFKDFDESKTIHVEGSINYSGSHSLDIQSNRAIPNRISLNQEKYEAGLGSITSNLSQILTLRYVSPEGEPTENQFWIEGNNTFQGESAELATPPLSVAFISASGRQSSKVRSEMFGRLELMSSDYALVKSLQLVEPRLKRITTIVVSGFPILYGDIGLPRLVPLSLMGEGLNRLVSILLTLATNREGLVLIDEIENGLHHSVLSKIWQVISDAAHRFNVQVIATTHSYECIQAASDIFLTKDSDSDFRLHRLDRIKEKFRSVTYDDEALIGAMQGFLEVR